jgi:hypothetical protein
MATTNKDFRVKNGLTVESGSVTAPSIIKTGGTSSQYLMADGSTSTGPTVSAPFFWRYTATGSETSLSGLDSSSQTLAYTAGSEQVYLNGTMLIRGIDYTATNGTSITGLSALTSGDYVVVIAMVTSSSSSGGGTTTNALTIGTGLSGTSFDGSSAVTIAIDSTVATLSDTQSLLNKTISGTYNTLSNIPNSALTNSSITINGSAVSLGGSTTITGLPSQTGNSGKYLTTDGSIASWSTVSGGTVSGTILVIDGGASDSSYSGSNNNWLASLDGGGAI